GINAGIIIGGSALYSIKPTPTTQATGESFTGLTQFSSLSTPRGTPASQSVSFQNAINDNGRVLSLDNFNTSLTQRAQISASQLNQRTQLQQRFGSVLGPDVISSLRTNSSINFRDKGGSIINRPRFGGTSSTDNVPAFLTNGEYVVRKSVVDALGMEFFERLNSGNVRRFQNGGPVGERILAQPTNKIDESIQKFVEITNDLKNTLSQRPEINRPIEKREEEQKSVSGGGIVNNVSITINIENGEVESTVDTTSQTNKPSNRQNTGNDEQRSRQLGELVRQSVISTIIDQKRPGGLLDMRNNSVR
ncbi:MAG: hypothetical protein AABY22_06050, partial [Nanoarchaeota archaeon]